MHKVKRHSTFVSTKPNDMTQTLVKNVIKSQMLNHNEQYVLVAITTGRIYVNIKNFIEQKQIDVFALCNEITKQKGTIKGKYNNPFKLN